VARLDELLARNLGCSRSHVRRLVDAGAVTLDGAPVDDARVPIAPERLPLTVTVEDQPLALYESFHLMLNKPPGVITALRDDRHPVAYALLEEAPLFPELRPIGRLDLDTTGLLLFTTEGAWLQRLTHPKRAVPRTYQAALARPFHAPPPDFVLEDGHRPALAELRPAAPGELHPALHRPPEATCYASITLTGGAYHEVRRIFAALGSHVLALCRVSFGRLRLPDDLASGAYRAIAPEDVL
jgi:16S rRNA pseudouridine516 synthase